MAISDRRTWLGVIGAILASTASVAQATQLPCFEEAAVQSARIHDLQIMLMVNAMKCRLRDPETLQSYRQLIEQRGREFDDHSRLVLLNLAAQYGERTAPAAYHSYETAIANYHSEVEPSMRQCQNVASIIALARQADHDELATLSRLATARAIDVCFGPATRKSPLAVAQPVTDAAAPAGPTRIAATAPAATAIPASAPAAPETEMVDGIPTYPVPGTGPDTKPEPLEKAVLSTADAPREDTEAKAAPASAEARLDEAITALSAAVTALQELRRKP